MVRGFEKRGYWFSGIRGMRLHCRADAGIKSNDQVTQIMSGWNFCMHAGRWKWQDFIYDTTIYALSICPSCCLMTFFKMIFLCTIGQHCTYSSHRVLINLGLYFHLSFSLFTVLFQEFAEFPYDSERFDYVRVMSSSVFAFVAFITVDTEQLYYSVSYNILLSFSLSLNQKWKINLCFWNDLCVEL